MKLRITVTRLEGPNSSANKSVVVSTFAAANIALSSWSSSAPKGGGYDKCSFQIVDLEGSIDYSGRYDLKHYSDETANLKTHVIYNMCFFAGRSCPERMSEQAYESYLRSIGINEGERKKLIEWAEAIGEAE